MADEKFLLQFIFQERKQKTKNWALNGQYVKKGLLHDIKEFKPAPSNLPTGRRL